jgi:K+/H+ antiporter YhaU regulatory subunit KhtT
MALYRLRGATGNENSYVYTNPDPTTIISHRDRVFVLGKEVSDETMGDKFEMMDR